MCSLKVLTISERGAFNCANYTHTHAYTFTHFLYQNIYIKKIITVLALLDFPQCVLSEARLASPPCTQHNDSLLCVRLGGAVFSSSLQLRYSPPPSLMTLEMKLKLTKLATRTSCHFIESRLKLCTSRPVIKHGMQLRCTHCGVELKLDGCLLLKHTFHSAAAYNGAGCGVQ